MNQEINQLWIDESGDAGFKFEKGSSRFIILASVYLIDSTHQEIEQELRSFRDRLGLPADHEFKFSRTKRAVKDELSKILVGLPIQYKAIAVDKQSPAISLLRNQPHQLYVESVKRLLYDNNPPVNKATLVVDESMVKIHQKEFNRMLKVHVSKNTVSKIHHSRSQSDSMIQIADFIAGSLFRKFEKNDPTHHDLIMSKEKILIQF